MKEELPQNEAVWNGSCVACCHVDCSTNREENFSQLKERWQVKFDSSTATIAVKAAGIADGIGSATANDTMTECFERLIVPGSSRPVLDIRACRNELLRVLIKCGP